MALMPKYESPASKKSLMRPTLGAEAQHIHTATDRVYHGIYQALLERRLLPGTRLREEELADSFGVSRTVVRQALQRLAADQLVKLEHNRGAHVPMPDVHQAERVFEARRVVECEIARLLAGQLNSEQIAELEALVREEARARADGDVAAAIRLTGDFHRVLAQFAGNPVFLRWIDELLPTTSLLIAVFQQAGQGGCERHRHQELLAALVEGGASQAAAEMRRHLKELERSLVGGATNPRPRDVFAGYREDPTETSKPGMGARG
jgi:DNA-binding GntR family transcriptional regulator